MMSPSRGRVHFGGRGGGSHRDYYNNRRGCRGGTGGWVQQRQVSFGSFIRAEKLPFDSDAELISFHDDTTSTSQDHSPLIVVEAPDTQLSDDGKVINVNTVVCRQCKVIGHPEIHCPYQIVIKQGFDRERHLVCDTVGHKAFHFNSSHGCLGCKVEREQGGCRISDAGEDVISEKTTRRVASLGKKTDLTVVTEQIQAHPDAAGVKVNATCGWEESEYAEAIEAVCRSMSGSFEYPVKAIAAGLVAHKLLEDNAKLWDGEEVDGVEGFEAVEDGDHGREDGQCLIQF